MDGGVSAVVLAGRPNRGRLASADGSPWEALIPVAGRPMLAYLLEALAGARQVAGGVVVGPPAVEPWLLPGFSRVDPAEDVVGHLRQALPRVAGPRVLVAASDLPLVRAAMVDRFLAACGDRGEEIYFPVVRREVAQGRYPGARRTYVHLKDGDYTAGNLFLVSPTLLLGDAAGEGVLARLLRWRKSPFRLARALGLDLFLALALRRLSLRQAEAEASRRLGVRGRAVVVEDPEVGMDVDKPADLALCREVLGHAAG